MKKLSPQIDRLSAFKKIGKAGFSQSLKTLHIIRGRRWLGFHRPTARRKLLILAPLKKPPLKTEFSR